MDTDQIINFIRIDERIATGGQPTEAQLAAARDEGFQAVINLAPVGKADPRIPRVEDEAGVLAGLGIDYRYIPVEWSDPRLKDFAAFSQAMDELADRKILIHCAANFRVTAFFSLYAMKRLGWDVERADALIARVWESQPGYRMDETWKSFIARVRGM